jgi:hypothetical protein
MADVVLDHGLGLIFDALMARGETEKACALAMELATTLLRQAPELYRAELWKRFFSRLDQHYRAQYQSYDFEIADYKMFAFGKRSGQLFRGPRPALADLASGNYVTVFGAAQFLGRFHRTTFCDRLNAALGVPFLNLSFGGAGPEFYSGNEEMIAAANNGKALVLQVLSGRSVGCEEYPGMRMTARAGSGDALEDRIELLKRIWVDDRAEAQRLVSKWRAIYLAAMQALMARIRVPIFLVWISDRRPGDWTPEVIARAPDFGSFPQLVDGGIVQTLASSAHHYIELPPDPQPEFKPTSRITGKNCPFFWPNGTLGYTNNYYPSEQLQIELAAVLQDLLRRVLV